MEVREYLHGITATIERLKVGGEESVGKDDSEFSNLGGAFNLLKHAWEEDNQAALQIWVWVSDLE